MSWIKKYLIIVLGWSFIISILYSFAILSLYALAVYGFKTKKIYTIYPLDRYQQLYYYFSGERKIWQNDPLCNEVDEELIYKPKMGICSFSNLEFNTSLSFDYYGRLVPARNNANFSEKGIAILGDSFAMGWGVNDADTFANIIQENTEKPVYNLAVASYATERELKRFVLSGLTNKVDTVIIQYCDNDLAENKIQLTDEILKKELIKFKILLDKNKANASFIEKMKYIRKIAAEALKAPFADLRHKFFLQRSEPDFSDHLIHLRKTLKRYEKYLSDKDVIVFYMNGHGQKFRNFPSGKDTKLSYLRFIDPPYKRSDFYIIDDHLNPGGQRHLGVFLSSIIRVRNSY